MPTLILFPIAAFLIFEFGHFVADKIKEPQKQEQIENDKAGNP
jgi:hypothetical protein